MQQVAPTYHRPTTNAAEGLRRWRWTLADIERLVAAGVFSEFDRVELIGGELVPMSPRGNQHEYLRAELSLRLARMTPETVAVASEPQLNLAEDEFRKPDILVFPRPIRVHDVRGHTAQLVIEIADTSLRWDTTAKARTYARYGVPDYWVVNVQTRETEVFRDPAPSGDRFASRRLVHAGEPLTALLVPEITIRLADID